MGYLSLYKTLADYNKDASNRQNPHVSLITDDKKLILINASNVSKEISNVTIVDSLADLNTESTTPAPMAVTLKCEVCGYTYAPDGDNNVCPKCGGQGIEIETTTTSEPTTTPTTTSPGGIYNTEMPIYVKMIDFNGNEVPNTIPVTFSIDCNGTSKDFTLTNSGTISGYHYLDNNVIESFFMVCKDSEMYYKENGYYHTMPEITSFGQFMDYHQKGGAIYIIVDYLLSSTTPAPDEKYTTLKCTKCGYEYPSNGNDNEVCPKCGGDGFEQTTPAPTDSTTPTSSPTTSPNPNK